jgi:hypothetical protein
MANACLELNKAIDEHIRKHGKEPSLIMLRDTFVTRYAFWFQSRLHSLCCGKGSIYNGIPTIVTPSVMVETYLLCY